MTDVISAVDCMTVRLPLEEPLWAAGLEITIRDFFIVRVTTRGGLSGYGFLKCRGVRLDAFVSEVLGPLILGEDPRRTEAIWHKMMHATFLPGRVGAVLRAIGCIDIALWDLKAQLANEPLYRLLGGANTEVKALVVAGYYGRNPDDTTQMAADLRSLRADGFSAFKIAGGMLSRARETPRIATARNAIGPDAELVVDVNWCWSDLKSALAAAREWAQFDLAWIEEPFPPGSTAKRQAFSRQSPIALGIGDEQGGVSFFRDLMAAGSADVIRLDTPVTGGITPSLRIIALAEAYGLPVSPHIYPEVNQHLALAFQTVGAVELFDPAGSLYQINRFITPGLQIKAGILYPPDAPGLGFSMDWPALTEFSGACI